MPKKSVKIDMIVKNNNLCCIFDRSYDHPQPYMSRVEELCFVLQTTLKNSIIQEENTKKNHKRVVSLYVIKNHVNLHKL